MRRAHDAFSIFTLAAVGRGAAEAVRHSGFDDARGEVVEQKYTERPRPDFSFCAQRCPSRELRATTGMHIAFLFCSPVQTDVRQAGSVIEKCPRHRGASC